MHTSVGLQKSIFEDATRCWLTGKQAKTSVVNASWASLITTMHSNMKPEKVMKAFILMLSRVISVIVLAVINF